jgi:hypothetical protein
MRTPDECRAKAADLEREARASKSDVRRQAFLELADHWRRLAAAHGRRQEEAQTFSPWARRRSRVN